MTPYNIFARRRCRGARLSRRRVVFQHRSHLGEVGCAEPPVLAREAKPEVVLGPASEQQWRTGGPCSMAACDVVGARAGGHRGYPDLRAIVHREGIECTGVRCLRRGVGARVDIVVRIIEVTLR